MYALSTIVFNWHSGLDLLMSAQTTMNPQVRICKRKGCRKTAYLQHEHCSRTCYKLSLQTDSTTGLAGRAKTQACACPQCPRSCYISERNVKIRYDYCSRACFHSHSDVIQQTKVVILGPDNYDYRNVCQKVGGALNIIKIARIIYPAALAKTHLTTTATAGLKGSLKFHGTTLVCTSICKTGLICNISGCTICSILKSGFVASFIRRGPGFYFAPDALTSRGYTVANAEGVSAMFLCSVYEPVATKAISNHVNTKVILPRFLICFR
ncbi:hypothetical protein BGZ83_008627 [Gryganskiella cystojenkinii]|nr:hypothetical protein BGZ83_008627 [Gryganskiella cystojenkinii]